jgi:hypothetical protein
MHELTATNKLRKMGDGSTDSSCMDCNPALPECFIDCQERIDIMYRNCQGVCLPDGYYFDPSKLYLNECYGREQKLPALVQNLGASRDVVCRIIYQISYSFLSIVTF